MFSFQPGYEAEIGKKGEEERERKGRGINAWKGNVLFSRKRFLDVSLNKKRKRKGKKKKR